MTGLYTLKIFFSIFTQNVNIRQQKKKKSSLLIFQINFSWTFTLRNKHISQSWLLCGADIPSPATTWTIPDKLIIRLPSWSVVHRWDANYKNNNDNIWQSITIQLVGPGTHCTLLEIFNSSSQWIKPQEPHEWSQSFTIRSQNSWLMCSYCAVRSSTLFKDNYQYRLMLWSRLVYYQNTYMARVCAIVFAKTSKIKKLWSMWTACLVCFAERIWGKLAGFTNINLIAMLSSLYQLWVLCRCSVLRRLIRWSLCKREKKSTEVQKSAQGSASTVQTSLAD